MSTECSGYINENYIDILTQCLQKVHALTREREYYSPVFCLWRNAWKNREQKTTNTTHRRMLISQEKFSNLLKIHSLDTSEAAIKNVVTLLAECGELELIKFIDSTCHGFITKSLIQSAKLCCVYLPRQTRHITGLLKDFTFKHHGS